MKETLHVELLSILVLLSERQTDNGLKNMTASEEELIGKRGVHRSNSDVWS